MRAGHVEAICVRRLDRRRDHVDLLAAQAAVLSGVRIEAGNGDARPRDAEIARQVVRGDLKRLDDKRLANRANHLFKRNVDGDRHDRNELGDEHHHRVRGSRLLLRAWRDIRYVPERRIRRDRAWPC